MNYVYPRDESMFPEESIMDDKEIADLIVYYRETGHTKTVAELSALAECHSPRDVKRVSAAIDEEIVALSALDPTKYATAKDFSDAVKARCVLLDATMWFDSLREKHGVQTFSELVAALTPKE